MHTLVFPLKWCKNNLKWIKKGILLDGGIMADKGMIKVWIAFSLKYLDVLNFDMGGGI